MSLLCLRATNVDHKRPSPVELLLGHPIQDNLLRKISRDSSSEEVISRLIERQQLQKHCYDRSAKPLPELAPGQRITSQDPPLLQWKSVEVKERLVGTPHSCAVTTATGRGLRHNRAHIQEAHQENRAVEPDWKEQTSSKDSSKPSEEWNHHIADTYTTRSGRLIKPPRETGSVGTELSQAEILRNTLKQS